MEDKTMMREAVDFLNAEWPEWKKEVARDINVVKEKDDKLKTSINSIVIEIRDLLKEKDWESANKEVNGFLKNKKLTEVLLQLADNSIRNYRITLPLRNMEAESIEITKGFIAMLFERAIVRVELGITERYTQYKQFDSEEEMLQVIQTLSMLTEFYVRKHWSKSTIIDDFRDETGCGFEVCECYSDLVDKYYNDLKFNIIIDGLEHLENQATKVKE